MKNQKDDEKITRAEWHAKHREERKNKKDRSGTRRDQVKHAALNPKYNSRIRQEYIDQDYLDDLDDTVKNCKLPFRR